MVDMTPVRMQNAIPVEVASRVGGAVVAGTDGGRLAGPALVVGGIGCGAEDAFARRQALPSLAFLRGSSTMVLAETPDAMLAHRDLPERADAVHWVAARDGVACYWSILGHAAQLGMIAGRGVSRVWRKAALV